MLKQMICGWFLLAVTLHLYTICYHRHIRYRYVQIYLYTLNDCEVKVRNFSLGSYFFLRQIIILSWWWWDSKLTAEQNASDRTSRIDWSDETKDGEAMQHNKVYWRILAGRKLFWRLLALSILGNLTGKHFSEFFDRTPFYLKVSWPNAILSKS
jgi:hypothetical protein